MPRKATTSPPTPGMSFTARCPVCQVYLYQRDDGTAFCLNRCPVPVAPQRTLTPTTQAPAPPKPKKKRKP